MPSGRHRTTGSMKLNPWNDDKGAGKRLASHGLDRLLSFDLEGKTAISAAGAVNTDRSRTYTWKGPKRGLRKALTDLDNFAKGATSLVGHNVIEHDLALLAKQAPRLKLHGIPAIDTLYLSPLAFPENPYHRLVKQYKEPALARTQANDPLLDAELTLELLADIADALKDKPSDLLLTWHALLAAGVDRHAFDAFFRTMRGVDATPRITDADSEIERRLAHGGCPNQAARIARDAPSHPLPLAYLLAWLPVAGGNSIIPPYVDKRFGVSDLAVRLRDTHCGESACGWCSGRLDPVAALNRWFGFPGFRDEPGVRAARACNGGSRNGISPGTMCSASSPPAPASRSATSSPR